MRCGVARELTWRSRGRRPARRCRSGTSARASLPSTTWYRPSTGPSKRSPAGVQPVPGQGPGKVPECRFHGLVVPRKCESPSSARKDHAARRASRPHPAPFEIMKVVVDASNPPVLRGSPPALGRSDSTCSTGMLRSPRPGTSTLSSTWRPGSLRHRRRSVNDNRAPGPSPPDPAARRRRRERHLRLRPHRALLRRGGSLRRPRARRHRVAQREARPPSLRKSRSASVGARVAARW
jgi:hypothetical protein